MTDETKAKVELVNRLRKEEGLDVVSACKRAKLAVSNYYVNNRKLTGPKRKLKRRRKITITEIPSNPVSVGSGKACLFYGDPVAIAEIARSLS